MATTPRLEIVYPRPPRAARQLAPALGAAPPEPLWQKFKRECGPYVLRLSLVLAVTGFSFLVWLWLVQP